jgi:AcrR family transcriptional regulator
MNPNEHRTIDGTDTLRDMAPHKSQLEAGSMRSRIIDAATALLRESGPVGASIRAICDVVGVKPPTLYHYFGNLETLQNSVLDKVITEYFQANGVRPGARDPYTRLQYAWDSFISFSIDEPFIYTFMVQQHFSGHLPQSIIESHADMINDLREIALTRPLRHSPDMCSQMFVAALLGTVAMLAAQNAGLDKIHELGRVMREETFRSLFR